MLSLCYYQVRHKVYSGRYWRSVFMTFRILDIADLTAEEASLGGGIAAIGIVNGMHPAIATLLAFGGGMLAGLVTGIFEYEIQNSSVISWIITMTGLYSVTSRVQ